MERRATFYLADGQPLLWRIAMAFLARAQHHEDISVRMFITNSWRPLSAVVAPPDCIFGDMKAQPSVVSFARQPWADPSLLSV